MGCVVKKEKLPKQRHRMSGLCVTKSYKKDELIAFLKTVPGVFESGNCVQMYAV